jgi:rare lipoprotein A
LAAVAGPPPAVALPERVEQGPTTPGRLQLQAGTFSGREAAAQQAGRLAALGARVEPLGEGPRRQFRVRIGPLPGVAEADRALEQVLASGVSEARILVD